MKSFVFVTTEFVPVYSLSPWQLKLTASHDRHHDFSNCLQLKQLIKHLAFIIIWKFSKNFQSKLWAWCCFPNYSNVRISDVGDVNSLCGPLTNLRLPLIETVLKSYHTQTHSRGLYGSIFFAFCKSHNVTFKTSSIGLIHNFNSIEQIS